MRLDPMPYIPMEGRTLAIVMIELLDAIDNPKKIRGASLAKSSQVRLAKAVLEEAKNCQRPEFSDL